MTAVALWTGKILRNFVHMDVAMIDLDEKLHRALQPCVKASHAGCLDDDGVIKVAKASVFEPRHQKSSADGILLYAILPPA